MTDGEPETAVSASRLQKIKSTKNQHKLLLFFIFLFHKSQTCDSFVNHFDGHFAFLKTLDFSFKNGLDPERSASANKTKHTTPIASREQLLERAA